MSLQPHIKEKSSGQAQNETIFVKHPGSGDPVSPYWCPTQQPQERDSNCLRKLTCNFVRGGGALGWALWIRRTRCHCSFVQGRGGLVCALVKLLIIAALEGV